MEPGRESAGGTDPPSTTCGQTASIRFLWITLHARVVVRGFYEKCGYTAEGTEFEEIGIPHIRMIRRIENR
jgi:predicted GNAT family N-acyltransferase